MKKPRRAVGEERCRGLQVHPCGDTGGWDTGRASRLEGTGAARLWRGLSFLLAALLTVAAVELFFGQLFAIRGEAGDLANLALETATDARCT